MALDRADRRRDRRPADHAVTSRPEDLIQEQAVALLRLTYRHLPFFRVAATNIEVRRAGRAGMLQAMRARRMGALNGTPDLHVEWRTDDGPPRHGWIEFKTKRGSLTDGQKDFRAECATHGVPWGVARSAEEAVVIVREWVEAMRRDHGSDQ